MVDVRSLTRGLFVTSCIVLLSLWLNSLIGSQVVEINATPQRQVLSGTVETETTATPGAAGIVHELINSEPTVFSNRSYVWRAPKTDEVPAMSAFISAELAEYSSNYLENIGLRQIILVDDIKNRSNQPVLGFSDPLAGNIYLNTVELEGEYSRAVIAEQTVHHEIAHFLAYARYGYWFERDSGWSKLDPDYSYGTVEGDSEYFPRNGFVSRYAMSSAGEDFAEVYSLIYTEYFKQTLSEEAHSSELLENKTRFVYETIATIDRDQCLASFQAFDSACD